MDTQSIREKIQEVKYPGFSRDILSFGLVKEVTFEKDQVFITIELTTSDASIPEKIAHSLKEKVGTLEGVEKVNVTMEVIHPTLVQNQQVVILIQFPKALKQCNRYAIL